jgi:hypothetical protein
MSTAKALRRQHELIREDGRREGEIKATDEVIAYLASQSPPAEALAKQFIADLKDGKHRKGSK